MAGKASQQPFGESSDVQAIVISDSLKMGFHGQSASKTALSVDLERYPQLMPKSKRTFPRSRLLVGQIRLNLPGLGVVGRCFPIGCY